MQRINCFLPYLSPGQVMTSVAELRRSTFVDKIYLLATVDNLPDFPGCELLIIDRLTSTNTLHSIMEYAGEASHLLLYQSSAPLIFVQYGLERMLQLAEDSRGNLVYADHYTLRDGIQQETPLIDYQEGSIRDDFNFGPLLLIRCEHLKSYFEYDRIEYKYAGLYDYRLRCMPLQITHIREYLYTVGSVDNRRTGEQIFDYVNPRNREVQVEMEKVATLALNREHALIAQPARHVDFDEKGFPCECSVIIPVRNRARTIDDAIQSVLMQQATFDYNLIIIDNHSTDGTTEIIRRYASDPRLIHIIPEAHNLGIGGCWNEGMMHTGCGRFCVQLDSDDLYSGPDTLQKIIDTFHAEHCAMVIGTYRMTDIDGNEIAPGIIDHREWTPENGRNNALRINGLGAPRAFYTPILREIKMPNVSYGEDYAVALRISRTWHIGRIYDVVYLCRRWEDNTDANLDVRKMNEHNLYKDSIRTWEIQARIKQNRKEHARPPKHDGIK